VSATDIILLKERASRPFDKLHAEEDMNNVQLRAKLSVAKEDINELKLKVSLVFPLNGTALKITV
jgi:hypothetical protein